MARQYAQEQVLQPGDIQPVQGQGQRQHVRTWGGVRSPSAHAFEHSALEHPALESLEIEYPSCSS